MHACRTYSMIRNQIFHKSSEQQSKKRETLPIIELIEKQKPVQPTYTDYKSTDNILIAIQNDQKLLKMILNCRKQKSLTLYMFVEPDTNVVLLIKNPAGCPIIMMKIPFSSSVYAKSSAMVFDFPIGKMLDQIKNTSKNNSSYEILFQREPDNTTTFVSNIFNSNGRVSTTKANKIGNFSMQAIHNIFLYGQSESKGRMVNSPNMSDKTEDTNYLTKFYQINIMLLKEISPANFKVFSKPASASITTRNYITVSNESVTFKTIAGATENEEILCTSDNNLIWLQQDEPKTYEMIPLDSVFKKSGTSKSSNDEKYYYVFAPFMNDHYMFIKISTPERIKFDDNQIRTLIKLFPDGHQTLECYICKEVS